MHVHVLGAGVVGITTAYYLSELGCRVTVIDREDDVAGGASYANGGQLSYSFTDALAKPGFLAKIPGLMLGRDHGSKMHLSLDLISWAHRFLRQCTSSRAKENTLNVLRLAMRSADLLHDLQNEHLFDFSHRPAGKLVLLPDSAAVTEAKESTALKNRNGNDCELLTTAEATNIEPAIHALNGHIEAAVYSRSDEVADAYAFCNGLREHLQVTRDVQFKLGESVEKLHVENGRSQGVVVNGGILEADAVIICLGAWSTKLLRQVGIDPHIYPVRGYSVTLPPGELAPSVSVTSLRDRIVLSRLNGDMRIAGFADFSGFDTRNDNARVRTLLNVARTVAPQAANYEADNQHHWGGFRPMTPNGQPIVGPTTVRGLYTNTGHGMLGWTLACATGYDAAQTVARHH